mmetsp:Transcript_90491/g.219500  ORF Transcript_90491/g.219500 Transcript_90491/m.219500 type:complete len:243 (-) Transcript_90491:288-1016(-)
MVHWRGVVQRSTICLLIWVHLPQQGARGHLAAQAQRLVGVGRRSPVAQGQLDLGRRGARGQAERQHAADAERDRRRALRLPGLQEGLLDEHPGPAALYEGPLALAVRGPQQPLGGVHRRRRPAAGLSHRQLRRLEQHPAHPQRLAAAPRGIKAPAVPLALPGAPGADPRRARGRGSEPLGGRAASRPVRRVADRAAGVCGRVHVGRADEAQRPACLEAAEWRALAVLRDHLALVHRWPGREG